MTDTIMQLMEEGRGCKGKGHQQYQVLNGTLHSECLIAKKRWMEETCTEIGDLDKRDNQMMYKKVQEIVGKIKFNNSIGLKKIVGTIAIEVGDVKARFNKCIVELYPDQSLKIHGSGYNPPPFFLPLSPSSISFQFSAFLLSVR